MTGHSPFHWPDEDGSRPSAALRLRHWLGLTPAGARPAARRRGWRLRELWRTRPVPMAAALVIGIGPLAWALQQGPWDRRAQERALAEAAETQWGEPPTPATAIALPAPAPAAADAAAAANGATSLTGLTTDTTDSPSGQARAREPGLPPVAAAPQWGDPLPGVAEAQARTALQTASRTPRADRQAETRTVLASEYFGRQSDPGAEPTLLAQASMRSGMRMRMDSPWQATRELLDAVNPFARQPRTASVAAAPAAMAGGRALRVAELPDVIGLPLVLPVSEDARTAGALSEGLTLQQAIDQTLARSLEVKAARERLVAARHTVRAATGSLLPQIEGRAGVGRGEAEPAAPATTDRSARREGTLTIRQPIVDVAARREVERQRVLATTAELQFQAVIGQVSQDAAEAYLHALQARIALAMSQRHERQLARLLAQVESRASGGTLDADRGRVQARVAQARAQRIEFAAGLRAALSRLTLMTGQTPQAFELGRAPSIAIPGDVTLARQDAARFNRDLLAGRAEAVALAYEGLTHRARLLPRLDLEFSHVRATNAIGMPGSTRDTRGMLTVNWQLYNGGADLAQQRASQARERERGLRAEDLLRRLDQELEGAYAALDAVAPRFAAQREELLANAAAASGYESQPGGGGRSLLEVLDAYQRLHANRLELAALVIHEVQRTLQVAQLTGRLVPAEPLERDGSS